MLTTERVNHLQPLWFCLSLSVFPSFCVGLCLSTLAFFLLGSPSLLLNFTLHYFIENSLFHKCSDAVFSLHVPLSISSQRFIHRASIEIYQCQMEHRILLNHIQSFSKWAARLKRIENDVFFFACVGNRCHHRFHHLIIHLMIHWEFCLDFKFIHFAIFLLVVAVDLIELLLKLGWIYEMNTQKSSHK